jgi:hypothetical protein
MHQKTQPQSIITIQGAWTTCNQTTKCNEVKG